MQSTYKMMEKFLAVFLLISVSVSVILAATDKTLEEKAVGKDVVEAVVTKIRRSNVFPEDYEFFRRLAYVESRDGTSNTTFANNFYGGIWQVNERYYNATRHASLTDLHTKIKNSTLQIDWANTTWTDLLKPLYSGVAAQLFVASRLGVNETIPQTIAEQGNFFDRVYNHQDHMNNATFVIDVEELDNQTVTCSGKMDLVIVLDASSSVGQDNFDICKKFVVDLIQTFSLATVRHGFLVYSSYNEVIFELDHNLNFQGLRNKTLEAYYQNERTDTNEALVETVAMFDRSLPRAGVPQVMSIFTDGKSTSINGVSNIQLLKDKEISSYVIGITNEVDLDQLEQLAYNIPNNVFTLTNFQVLAEFFKRLNSETCKLPQKPELATPTEDVLNSGERRYYEFTVPAEGITLSTSTELGRTSGYYSLTEKNPTSALSDGELRWEGVFIPPTTTRAGEDVVVYVSVEGLEPANNYTIVADIGFQVSSTTTTEAIPTTEEATTEEVTEEPSTSEPASTAKQDESTPEPVKSTPEQSTPADVTTTTEGSSDSLIIPTKLILFAALAHYLLVSFNIVQN